MEGFPVMQTARATTARTIDPAARQKRDQGDLALVLRARNGNDVALDQLIRRYQPFVRLKASSYFLAGGDSDDLQQEGLIGLYKAIRDYRVDRETSFRSFAELCITRQIITANCLRVSTGWCCSHHRRTIVIMQRMSTDLADKYPHGKRLT